MSFDWKYNQPLNFPNICPFCEGNQPILNPIESAEVYYEGKKISPKISVCSKHFAQYVDFIQQEKKFMMSLFFMFIGIPFLILVVYATNQSVFWKIISISIGLLIELWLFIRYVLVRKRRTDIFWMDYHGKPLNFHYELYIRAKNDFWMREFIRINPNLNIFKSNFDLHSFNI